jgi:hypothetical protein
LVRRVYKCANPNITHLANAKTGPTLEGWAVLPTACSHFLGLGTNCAPHTGQSICSKSTRRAAAGEIKPPHFGHTASSDARTFSRLIFRERGMIWAF